ncbi:MAG TPA: DMT family transporter [Verrucomicrobiae bacterium]|nr:DMT family transporter [Verrucomicrobiae bacterium]
MWLANLGLLAVAFAWGSQIPVLTILLAHWDPYFLAAARYVLAVPVLLLMLRLLESRHYDLSGLASGRVWILGTALGLFVPLYTLGIAHADPNTAAIIGSMGPVIAGLVGWIGFRLPIERSLWPSIVLALAGGILATYRPEQAGSGFDIRGGEFLILLGALCWNWYSLAAQRWLGHWSQLKISVITMVPAALVSAVVYGGAVLLGAAPWPVPAPRDALDVSLLLWMTATAVILGLILWNYGVLRLGIVISAFYLNFVPVFAILIISLLGTPPSLMQLLGGLLVLIGVLQSQLRHLPGRRKAGAAAKD